MGQRLVQKVLYEKGYMKYWKTKSGEKIKITDMSDEHIQNVICMLNRAIDSKPDYQRGG